MSDRAGLGRILETIERDHGLGFTLRKRFESGLQGGAWLIEDEAGTPYVLKLGELGTHFRDLTKTIDRLRREGYPTPQWLGYGETRKHAFAVQKYLKGGASTPLDNHKAKQLIEVLELQANLDPEPERNWSDHIKTVATEEGSGTLRQQVRDLGTHGDRLLAHFDQVLAKYPDVRLPRTDMVHGDFNSCNILLYDNKVSGVIDIDAMGSGTRIFDYAALLREAYVEGYGGAVTEPVRVAAERIAGPGPLVLCAAATSFDIVRFKMRHQPERMDEVLDRLHQLASDLSNSH